MTDRPEVPSDVEPAIEEAFAEASGLWRTGDYEAAQQASRRAWDLIPEPKFSWDMWPQVMSRRWAEEAAHAGLTEEGKAWLALAYQAYSPLKETAQAMLDFTRAGLLLEEGNSKDAFRLFDAVYKFTGKAYFNKAPAAWWEFYNSKRTVESSK